MWGRMHGASGASSTGWGADAPWPGPEPQSPAAWQGETPSGAEHATTAADGPPAGASVPRLESHRSVPALMRRVAITMAQRRRTGAPPSPERRALLRDLPVEGLSGEAEERRDIGLTLRAS